MNEDSSLSRVQDFQVRKGEDLIEAKFKLPLIEQRILAVAISKINPKKDAFENPYRFSAKEYCELAGVSERGMFKVLRDAIESLKTRTLSKYDSTLKRERIFGWLTQADVWDDGNIDLYIHPELTNDLLTKRKYAEYVLKNCFSFKSKYSLRFFELINHWSFKKNKKVNIDVFKEMMGLEANEYEAYAEFKRNVLSKVIKEINEQTEFYVTLNEFRQKRKVHILEFIIDNSAPAVSSVKKKKATEDISKIEEWLNPNKEDLLIQKLSKVGIGAMAGVKLIEGYGSEKVEKVIDLTLSEKREGKFSENINLAGVVINRVKDPDPEQLPVRTTSEELETKRNFLVSWLEEKGISYEPYNFSGNWVGVSLKGGTINFMNDAFKEEVEKIMSKNSNGSEGK